MHPAKQEFRDIVTPKYIYSQNTIKGRWKMCPTSKQRFQLYRLNQKLREWKTL